MRKPLTITAAVLGVVLLAGTAFAAGTASGGGNNPHGTNDTAYADPYPDPDLGTEDGHDHGEHEDRTGPPATYDPNATPGAGFRARDAALAPSATGRS